MFQFESKWLTNCQTSSDSHGAPLLARLKIASWNPRNQRLALQEGSILPPNTREKNVFWSFQPSSNLITGLLEMYLWVSELFCQSLLVLILWPDSTSGPGLAELAQLAWSLSTGAVDTAHWGNQWSHVCALCSSRADAWTCGAHHRGCDHTYGVVSSFLTYSSWQVYLYSHPCKYKWARASKQVMYSFWIGQLWWSVMKI